jgi:carbon monoxide dehydrogenase subunit G
MAEISSEKKLIRCDAAEIYNFLADFNNFESLMPSQVTNWKSDTDTCSFTIQGIGEVKLKIVEKEPHSKIVIIPDAGTKIPFTFKLICLLQTIEANSTETIIKFEHEMPMMIAMMAGRPLQNLVDILSTKLKERFEK